MSTRNRSYLIVVLVGIMICLLASGLAVAQSDSQSATFGPPSVQPASSDLQGLGQASVDNFNGEFTTSVAIQVPAYHGLEPKLALQYHSQGGNGFVGAGWSLSGASEIERASPGKGAPTYTASDIFMLDGMPLVACASGSASPSCQTCPLGAGAACYSTQIENYEQIAYTRSSDSWVITSKTGTQATYGPVYTQSQGTFRYLLTSVTDTHYNTVQYNYWCQSGQDCYLDNIQYNGTKITLYRASRPDPIVFASGFNTVAMNYRLNSIDVQVSGIRARTYQLAYTVSPSTSNSLLAGVTQYGTDATLNGAGTVTGGTALPGSGFQYLAGGTTIGSGGGGSVTGWGIAVGANVVNLQGDVNGDGKADLIQLWNNNGEVYVSTLLSTGSNLGTASGGVDTGWKWMPGNQQFFVDDVNGDGKADLIEIYNNSGVTYTSTALSNGTSIGAGGPNVSTGWGWQTAGNQQFLVGDVNGDGKADLILLWNSNGIAHVSTALSNGSSIGAEDAESSTNWVWSPATEQFFAGDVNGDGKTDIILLWDNGGTAWVSTALSNGTNIGVGSSSVNTNWAWQGAANTQFFTGDVNGDGKTDLIVLQNIGGWAYVSTSLSTGSNLTSGTGYVDTNWAWQGAANQQFFTGDVNGDGKTDLIALENIAGSTNVSIAISNGSSLMAGTGFVNTGWQWNLTYQQYFAGDVNGDGKTDVFLLWGGGSAISVWASTALALGAPSDLMSSAANGLGGTTAVTYTPSSTWTNQYLPYVVQTVSSLAVSDGIGDTSRTNYNYSGGLYDAIDRRFLGFHYAKATLPCNPEDNGSCPYVETWFHQDYGSYTKPQQINRSNGAGNLTSATFYTYTENGSTAPYTSLLTAQADYTYDGTGGTACPGVNCKRTLVDMNYDEPGGYEQPAYAFGFGNLTSRYTYPDLDASGTANDLTETFYYAPNPGRYIVGLQAAKNTYQGIWGALMAQSLIYYDGNVIWTQEPSVGNATQHLRRLISANAWVGTATGYDGPGDVARFTDEMGNTTTTGYDGTYLAFPTTTTNALNQTTTLTWNAACGVVTQKQGINGANDLTTTTYDALCRPTLVSQPLGAYQQISYVNFGAPWQSILVGTPTADGISPKFVQTYYDGLGRAIQVNQSGPSPSTIVYSRTLYNARGMVSAVSQPIYFTNGANVGTQVWTKQTYLPRDWPWVTTNPDGTTKTMSYNLWSATMTDELGHSQTTVANAYGKPVSHTDAMGNTTTYLYDSLQRLVGIVDASGNQWGYAWDSLGRKTQANDPDLGIWNFGYQADGRLTSQTDAKGQTTEYVYDALGRKTSDTALYGTALATTNTWAYDQSLGFAGCTGAANIGRVTSEKTPVVAHYHCYDLLGRQTAMSTVMNNTTYNFAYGYDAGGRLKWTTYPDGDTVGTASAPLTYDNAGRAVAIPNIVTKATYTPWGALATLANANGTVATDTYDLNERIAYITTWNAAGAAIQNLAYSRDNAGQLTAISSPFASETWSTLSHDADGRLLTATNTDGTDSQTFTYDGVGNITSNSMVGTYAYSAPMTARPHAATQAGSIAYTYDANGNMTAKGGTTYVWDARNHLASVGSTVFTYDANGVRVMKAVTGTTNYYVTPSYQVTNGVVTKFISLGSDQVATRVGTTNYWMHKDQVGSAQVMTDVNGNQYNRYNHRPFGDRFQISNANLNDSIDYTGQRRDIETGLVYLGNRYYDPVLARFTAADQSDPMKSGVGLNRYTYAKDDPVDYIDDGNAWSIAGTVDSVTGFFAGSFEAKVTVNDNASITVSIESGVGVGVGEEAAASVKWGVDPGAANPAPGVESDGLNVKTEVTLGVGVASVTDTVSNTVDKGLTYEGPLSDPIGWKLGIAVSAKVVGEVSITTPPLWGGGALSPQQSLDHANNVVSSLTNAYSAAAQAAIGDNNSDLAGKSADTVALGEKFAQAQANQAQAQAQVDNAQAAADAADAASNSAAGTW